jgi:ATP/maltotriose-dependent transcriptional regulator MalT
MAVEQYGPTEDLAGAAGQPLEEHNWLDAINALACVHFELGDYTAVLRLSEEGLDTSRRVYGNEHGVTQGFVGLAGIVHVRNGDHEAALPLLEESLRCSRQTNGDNCRASIVGLCNIGTAHRGMGNVELAQNILQDALRRATQLFGPQHPDTMTILAKEAASREVG